MQLETTATQWINVSGTPEGNEAANPGSIAQDRTNGTLYIKVSGTGNTGWEQVSTGGDVPQSFVANSGTATPSSGFLNTLGGGSITSTGAGNTLTYALTGLTANTILLGNGTSTINPLPNSTTGNLLVANTGADPGWASTLAGSFTLSKASSGSDVSFNVINTSNTASSTANVTVQVAGATASDAYQVFKIASGQEYSLGLDNSDSDSFVIAASNALGTTNVMRVSTAGEINYPLQPAFFATVNGNKADVTGDGTSYPIVFDLEQFDQNSDFNTTTGVFTAPVTGNYQFNVNILLLDAILTMQIQSTLTTTARTYNIVDQPVAITANHSIAYSVLAPMTAGDTAYVTVIVSGGTKVVNVYGNSLADPRTNFSGYLVC